MTIQTTLWQDYEDEHTEETLWVVHLDSDAAAAKSLLMSPGAGWREMGRKEGQLVYY